MSAVSLGFLVSNEHEFEVNFLLLLLFAIYISSISLTYSLTEDTSSSEE